MAFLQPFIPVSAEIADVGIDELNDRLSGKERPRQGIHPEGAHDLIIEALAVKADTLHWTKRAVVLIVQTEDDLGRAAVKGFPIPLRVRLFY
jgi:hypothetical protein